MTATLTKYILTRKMRGVKRFPLVLMLEPTHKCNLSCVGCGRIREYKETLSRELTLDECLASAEECGAPVVSVCGGEPLVYKPTAELVRRLTEEQRRYVYLCTNGTLVRKRIGEFRPSRRLFVNVHIDGMEKTHDACVDRPGVFKECVEAIKELKARNFMVCTNSTVYKETDVGEIHDLFALLTELRVDGMILSPAYSYEDAKTQEVFMDRAAIRRKFVSVDGSLSKYKLYASPIYMEFLRGERDLACTAWANPTRNPCGWKAPCYLITDAHYPTFKEMMEKTPWEKYGCGHDPRCKDCMVHCGYEPTAALAANRSLRDGLKMLMWQIR